MWFQINTVTNEQLISASRSPYILQCFDNTASSETISPTST